MLPKVAELGLVGEGAGRLRQGHEPNLMLVFDRGGRDCALVEDLGRLGVALIAWRKGPKMNLGRPTASAR